MAYLIGTTTKNYILDALGDATNGLIRVWIYDDSGTIIDAEATIAWGSATGGSMSMSSADIVFNVPASTVVSGLILSFYSETMTTGITHTFETQYTYNNAGTFTLTDVTLSVA